MYDKIGAYQRNIKELDNFMAKAAMKSPVLDDEIIRYNIARQALLNPSYERATRTLEPSGKDYPKVVQTDWSTPQ